MTCLTDWYAEGKRLTEVSAAEHAARPPLGPFVLADDAAAWADDVARRCGTEALPLSAAIAPAWAEGLRTAGLRDAQERLAYVTDALVTGAALGGALVLPEPGKVRLAYAHRGPDESERAWGWGFKPMSTEALVYHATRALGVDDLDSTPRTGGDAVVHVLQVVAFSLRQVRPGPAVRGGQGW